MPKVFRVNGSYRAKHHDQPFNIEIVADTAARAKELILTRIGSKHGVPRRLITVAACAEVPMEKVENAAVRHRAEMK